MNRSKGPDFLAHDAGDSVAVALRDLEPGDVSGGYLAHGSSEEIAVKLAESVPLGHKFALRDITEGEQVIKYGVPVAVATEAIPAGRHAHVHNLRSIRWQRSTAN